MEQTYCDAMDCFALKPCTTHGEAEEAGRAKKNTKQCLGCGQHFDSSQFSSRQWRSGWTVGRRCLRCVRDNKAPQPAEKTEAKVSTTPLTTKQCSECHQQVARSGMSSKMWRAPLPVCSQCASSDQASTWLQQAFQECHQSCLSRACEGLSPEEREHFCQVWQQSLEPHLPLKFPERMAGSVATMMHSLSEQNKHHLKNKYREVWCLLVQYMKEILFPVAPREVAPVETAEPPPIAWPDTPVAGFLITSGASNGRRVGAQKEFSEIFQQHFPSIPPLKVLGGVGKCFVFFQLTSSDDPHALLRRLYQEAPELQFQYCEVVTPLQSCVALSQKEQIKQQFTTLLGPLSEQAPESVSYAVDFKCHDRHPVVRRDEWIPFFADLVPSKHRVSLGNPSVTVCVRVFAANGVQQVGFAVRPTGEISRTPRDAQDYHRKGCEGESFYQLGVNLNLTEEEEEAEETKHVEGDEKTSSAAAVVVPSSTLSVDEAVSLFESRLLSALSPHSELRPAFSQLQEDEEGENSSRCRESSNKKRKLRAERSDGQVAALANLVVSELNESGVEWGDCWTVEFGAGKGSLTQGIRVATTGRLGGQVLVDRDRGFKGSSKRQSEGEHVWTDDVGLRLRIDMANLVLAGLPALHNKRVFGVGKHVCGAATDLALRCVAPKKSARESQGLGGVIALCCYHRCSWGAYLNQEWVKQCGFSSSEFEQIVKLTSWCHIRPSAHVDSAAKAKIANLCKQFIDTGRALYLQERGYQARVVEFVDSALTLENKALIFHKPQEQQKEEEAAVTITLPAL